MSRSPQFASGKQAASGRHLRDLLSDNGHVVDGAARLPANRAVRRLEPKQMISLTLRIRRRRHADQPPQALGTVNTEPGGGRFLNRSENGAHACPGYNASTAPTNVAPIANRTARLFMSFVASPFFTNRPFDPG